MRSFLDQLPTLVGVLLGALASMAATSFTERARWRRDQAVRWDDRRLAAYAAYAKAIKTVQGISNRLAAELVPGLRATPIDRATGVQLLADAAAERSRAWESLLLLGDTRTVAAARAWRAAIWQLEQLAVDPDRAPHGWFAAIGAVDQARDVFYSAARASLGVKGGSVSQAGWLSADAPWLPDRPLPEGPMSEGPLSGDGRSGGGRPDQPPGQPLPEPRGSGAG